MNALLNNNHYTTLQKANIINLIIKMYLYNKGYIILFKTMLRPIICQVIKIAHIVKIRKYHQQ